MSLLHTDSLALTLDSISEALFFGNNVDSSELAEAVVWISSRQGLPGSYAGMFAPTEADMCGIRLFTGERVNSRAGIGHHLGEEACRILHALGANDSGMKNALGRAVAGMTARLEASERLGFSTACYCCGTCSAGYWRNLAKGLFSRSEERLEAGLSELKKLRSDDGGWERFPFLYTSLALTEIDTGLSGPELRYIARRWEKILPRHEKRTDAFSRRRAAVGKRVLERC